MKIIVNDKEGTNLHLTFPTGLILNRLSVHFMSKGLAKKGVPMTRGQMLPMIKALNQFRRSHKDWKLVEVQSADGEYVEIIL